MASFKKLLKPIRWGIQVSIALVFVEITYRLLGYAPYQYDDFVIQQVEPPGYFVQDSLLGYKPAPGVFHLQYESGFAFSATHDSLGRRICRKASTAPATKLPKIFITGCSYAYGHGLPDSLTLGWQLQERLPDYEVQNLAVSAYGTVQALLQVRDFIQKKDIPNVLVVTYAGFHRQRNTYSRKFRKILRTNASTFSGVQFPFSHEHRKIPVPIQYAPYSYEPWYLSEHFALAHFIENVSNHLALFFNRSQKITESMLIEIADHCKKHDIRMIVAGITSGAETKWTLDFCKKTGIKMIDISIDPADTRYTLHPYDNHPNGLANEGFATGIADKIAKSTLKPGF